MSIWTWLIILLVLVGAMVLLKVTVRLIIAVVFLYLAFHVVFVWDINEIKETLSLDHVETKQIAEDFQKLEEKKNEIPYEIEVKKKE